jgi:hypothetical protein
MTPLPLHSLEFSLSGNGMIPCTGEPVSFELSGEAAELVDCELVRNAAAAVLHYFRHELKRASVSPEEFSAALERVLHEFGLTHLEAGSGEKPGQSPLAKADLRTLIGEDALELVFFQRLRLELRRQLAPEPNVVCFHGLRSCVKQLAGAQRWSPRCQTLHDRIVDFLRSSLSAEPLGKPCGLVVH